MGLQSLIRALTDVKYGPIKGAGGKPKKKKCVREKIPPNTKKKHFLKMAIAKILLETPN